MGPITIFDKSTLQSLNPDEAVWFNNFYRSNITPLFFVETLGNLEKEVGKGRTPEQVVGSLAYKSPVLGASANVHHHTLCIADLLGQHVEMRSVPVIADGRPISAGRRRGIYFDQPPEFDALSRWQAGDFLGIERRFARVWRQALSALDLRQSIKKLKIDTLNIRTLDEAHSAAVRLTRGDARRYATLIAALEILDIPQRYRNTITNRWKLEGRPSLLDFAPYAAHVFCIDVFFYTALAADLISPDRASNRVDVAYLYYIPFCMVFVSNDKLHAKIVPLFLAKNQVFVLGQELKSDLKKLDDYYSGLPAEVRERGVMAFAQEPPSDGNYLTSHLWDQFLPGWRKRANQADKVRNEAGDRAILDALKPMIEAAKRGGQLGPVSIDTADNIVISRKVPVRMGKWRLLPPGVEDVADK